LIKALSVAFAKAEELGAAKKAIIFTESRRTQEYLLRVLADSPYADGIVLFNGSNTDLRSKQIYAEWFARHEGSDRITDSRTADMRSALVDYFRESGRIMIATEAGAEGINLQFCSLVVNYDLPWNPQRIEQRIGRCHRYGQKHDVVVVNFLNRKNEADQRVYQLLSEKFKLFEGVFGASDEVLGAIESGVDFEKRIGMIYQQCRQTTEIKAAFDQLQLELSLEIDEAMSLTRQKLLENFDDEVREKLKIRDEDAKVYLDRFERLLMRLTEHELGDNAEFQNVSSFRLKSRPAWINGCGRGVPLGLYELPRRSGDAHLYRLSHPLGEAIIGRAKSRELPPIEIAFDYTHHSGRVTVLEPLRGRTGWLTAAVLTVDALDTPEDHMLLIGLVNGDGANEAEALSDDVAMRLLTLAAYTRAEVVPPTGVNTDLAVRLGRRQKEIQGAISERNARFFEAEADKLDGWADDLKVGLEREIKEIDRQIREARRAATAALTLEEKLAGQKEIRALETLRNTKRRTLFDAQDEIDKQRANLIAQIEVRLEQRADLVSLFTIRWTVV
jgi:Helicase conserved C-terminal domain